MSIGVEAFSVKFEFCTLGSQFVIVPVFEIILFDLGCDSTCDWKLFFGGLLAA